MARTHVILALAVLACSLHAATADWRVRNDPNEPKAEETIPTGPVEALNVKVKWEPPRQICRRRITEEGDVIKIHYTGYLEDGTQFDTSRGGDPLEFRLGSRMVIEGMDQGLQQMCKGELRLLEIPAEMAYGAEGAPPKVPPNTGLRFDIEFVDWSKKDKVHAEMLAEEAREAERRRAEGEDIDEDADA